jgi:hypothetical protein
MDFFGFVPPSLIGGIQCTTYGRKRPFCSLLEAVYILYSLWALWPQFKELPDEKFTPSELGNWLFKRQVEDDTLSQAMSHCSLDGSPTDLELEKASQPIGQISRSSQRHNQYINPFDSSIFLSAMWKSSNALVTFSDRICFECDEKWHYVNKCPQRRPKDQPTETGITTL